MSTSDNHLDYLPTARLTKGKINHYVDHYRYDPPRLLCKFRSSETIGPDVIEPLDDLPLCKVCVKTSQNYPTEQEYWDYFKCTDCGVDTRLSGEADYGLKHDVWNQAYPGYTKSGIGVGDSRPCLSCLEKRLGRDLVNEDFHWGHGMLFAYRERKRMPQVCG